MYASLITEMYDRLAPIYEAVRGAASADAGVREVWETIGAERSVGARNLIGLLVARGPLREGLTVDAACDLMWVLNDPGLYHLLVNRRGWPVERFETWLTETMQGQFLPSARPDRTVAGA